MNEDALLDRADLGLWAVADGMGGHEAGEVASALTVEALGALPPEARLERRVEAAATALQRVNQALVDMAADRRVGHGRPIGTTVVALALGEGRYELLWAGDSRAYLLRGRHIRLLSRDHSLVADLVDAGMLSPEEAASHPDANIITRAVGASAELRLDRTGGDARSGDLFLLASDGLTRLVPDDSIASTLLAMNPMQAARRLVEMTLERGAPDNVTVVIVRIG